MQFAEGVRLALHQLRTQKLKTFFSLLGVIVGVMFLIVVVSIVEGIDRYVREDLASVVWGVNTVTIQRFPDGPDIHGQSARARRRRPRLEYADWEALQELMTTPSLVGAESGTGGAVVGDNGRRIEQVRIMGVSPEMLTIRDWVVENGRPFSDQEASRGTAVVIIGKDPAEALFPNADPIGRTMRIRGFQYRIIGVLEEQGSIFGQSLDNLVIAPARSAIQAVTAPHGTVDQIIIQTLDPADIREAKLEAEEIMRIRRRLRPGDPNNFAVETADDTLRFWDRISQVLFLALPGLVAISLVVGGIVIMNIMLVSVLERTREIGVRKALGARRRDILTQVLIESVTLSGFGAMFGVGIGIGLTFLVRAVSPLPAAVAPKWVALGVILGLVVGIVSGVYPASQASKLNPVDALRHE